MFNNNGNFLLCYYLSHAKLQIVYNSSHFFFRPESDSGVCMLSSCCWELYLIGHCRSRVTLELPLHQAKVWTRVNLDNRNSLLFP